MHLGPQPARRGPGNNQFLYLHDEDGAMIDCCSEIAQMTADHYQPKDWSRYPSTINQWGAPPPLRFLLTGFPIADPQPRPSGMAMAADRTATGARA